MCLGGQQVDLLMPRISSRPVYCRIASKALAAQTHQSQLSPQPQAEATWAAILVVSQAAATTTAAAMGEEEEEVAWLVLGIHALTALQPTSLQAVVQVLTSGFLPVLPTSWIASACCPKTGLEACALR